MSFLPVKNITDLFDFQLPGSHNNWRWSLHVAPSDNVLTISFKIENGTTLQTFLAYKIDIKNDIVTVLDTISLISNKTIASIAENSAGVSYKVTTSASHYYKVGDVVTQSGFVAPNAAYNGAKTILSVPSATEYIVAGTYTNNVAGLVAKSLVTVEQTGNWYSIAANEGLTSNLLRGFYYYYFFDGVNQRKSDIFYIDDTIKDFNKYFVNNNHFILVDNNGCGLVTF